MRPLSEEYQPEPDESAALDAAIEAAEAERPASDEPKSATVLEEEDEISRLLRGLNDSDEPAGGGTPLPGWQSPAIASELAASGPPTWLGTRWREIPVEDQEDAWVGLRRWVDWLVDEFSLPTAVVPACWFRHPPIVAELHAAMNMEYKVWEEQAPTLNPMLMWLPHLQMMVSRLRTIVESLGSCRAGEHKEHETRQLEYDSELWAQTVFGREERRTLDRPTESGTYRYVRARIVGDGGEIRATSNRAGLIPVTRPDEVTVTLTGERVPGAANTRVTARMTGVTDHDRLVWEEAPDREGPWRDLGTDEDTDMDIDPDTPDS